MSLQFRTPESGLNTVTRGIQNMSSGTIRLTDVSVEYNANGEYQVELPEGYDGFSSVEVVVDVEPVLSNLWAASTTEETVIYPMPGEDGYREVHLNAITASIDSNIKADNIKKDVTILGVTGTLEADPVLGEITLDPMADTQITASAEAYGYDGFSQVTVSGVTSDIDDNITSDNIKNGVTILGVTGTYEGQSLNIGEGWASPAEYEYVMDPTEEGLDAYSSVTIAAVTSAIDTNIKAHNIKKDVTILGVTGTYEGGGSGFEVNATNKVKFGGSGFTSVPEGITFKSDITDWSNMFAGCSKLTSVSNIDASNGTKFNEMFSNCTALTSVALNTSKGEYFTSMFNCCYYLTSVSLDTSKGCYFTNMFQSCSRLTTIEGIDYSSLASNQTSASYMFPSSNNITSITVNGYINKSLNFSFLTKIDYASVKSILTAASRTTNADAKSLTFNLTMTDQSGELEALVEACTAKGWTITGLTLN